MNTYQVSRQVRYLLISRNWTGSSNKVFGSGSVLVSQRIGEEAKTMLRSPFALIRIEDGTIDPLSNQQADYIQQRFGVLVGSATPGDHVGEKALLGANIPDRTKSEGRGILELEEELFAAIEFLNTQNGVVTQFKAASAVGAELDPALGYVAYRTYSFEALLTADRYYHAPRKLAATGGVGSVSLTWQLPPDRYDRFRILLRRATGSTAPADQTAGTAVTLGSNLATSVTDSGLSAGTYSYSVFCAYDETNATPAQEDRYSGVENGMQVTSITVT